MTSTDTQTAGDGSRSAQFTHFSRAEWAALRASTPLQLSEDDLAAIRGVHDRLSLDEAARIYLPLTRLLNLQVAATQQLRRVTDTFLGSPALPTPFIIGLAGSVAVGKSTTARLLQTLLARWPEHPRVALVTTDGFLYPNAVLEKQGLMARKGFPESYDRPRLLQFVRDVKEGRPSVAAPLYSHLIYDIAPGERQVVDRPDILILEGLNVLQRGMELEATGRRFVSDYFDFSIYVDAEEADIREWFLGRFLKLREDGVSGRTILFPALRTDACGGGLGHRAWNLGADQRRKPAREYRADPRDGEPGAEKRAGPRRDRSTPAPRLTIRSKSPATREKRSLMTPRHPDHAKHTRDAILVQPFAQYLGFTVTDIGPGLLEIQLPLLPHHLQQDAIVHGGVTATLADTCLAMAAHTLIAPGERVVTIEFKINYLRPGVGQMLRCVGMVLRPGRTITTTEAEIYARDGEQERLIAKAIGTVAILPPNAV